jgi:hypothetical protein
MIKETAGNLFEAKTEALIKRGRARFRKIKNLSKQPPN